MIVLVQKMSRPVIFYIKPPKFYIFVCFPIKRAILLLKNTGGGTRPMADTHKLTRAAASAVLDKALKYIDKNPEENVIKLVDRASAMIRGMFPPENFEKIKT